jgi:hypothetical protein
MHRSPGLHGLVNMTTARIFAIAILFAGLFAAVAPTTHAANGDWTPEYLTGLSDSVREIALAHDGERLAAAYKYANSNGVGFSIRAAGASGAWTQQNPQAVAAATNLVFLHLVNTGAGKWLIMGMPNAGGFLYAYTSTDDGATWTQATAYTGTPSGYDVVAIAGGKVGLGVCTTGGGPLTYKESLDGGATWSAGFRLDDNLGNPSQSSGTAFLCYYSPALTARSDGTIYLEGNGFCGGGIYACTYSISSLSGGTQFWSVPFYNGGACPTGCAPVDGSAGFLAYASSPTTNQPWFLASPQNGDPIVSYRNTGGSCASANPHTRVFSAAYQGAGTYDTTGTPAPCTPTSGFQGVSSLTGCTDYGFTKYDRIAGNSAHTFIEAFGHTTLCGGVGFEVNLKSSLTAAWVPTYTDVSQSNVFDVDMTPSKSYVAFVDTAAASQVKVIWANTPTAVAPTPNASATVTGLVGFDVDPTGGTAIARTSTGAIVSVFSGQSLGAPVTSVETGCNRDSGVTAFTLHVAYVTCDPATHNANVLRIRTNMLAHVTTEPLNQCDSQHPIFPGSDDYTLNPDPEAYANEVRTFQLLSIDFTQAQNTGHGGINQCRLQAAFGASFETGKVGVLTADATKCLEDDCISNHDAPRRIASAWSQYDPAGNPISHMCAVLPIAVPGQSSPAAVMAADDSGTTKIYMWNRDTFSPQVNLAESAAGIFSQGRGIGCGKGDKALIETATAIVAFNITSQQQAWPPIPLSTLPPLRGAAESYDGKWGAAVTSGSLCPSSAAHGCVLMLNMTTGGIACTAPLPAGDFREVRLTEKAQNLFDATSSEIDRWDMHACTTGQSQGEGSFDDGCGPTAPTHCPGAGGPGSGGAGDSGKDGASSSYWTDETKFVLGILVIVVFCIFAAKKVSENRDVIFGFGILGWIADVFFGLWPVWSLIAAGAIGVAAFGKRITQAAGVR